MKRLTGTQEIMDTVISIRSGGVMEALSLDDLDGVVGGVIQIRGETSPFAGALSEDQKQMIQKVAAAMKKMGISFRATADSVMQALSQSDGLNYSFFPAVESYLQTVWDSIG